jgi:hypothetical protein
VLQVVQSYRPSFLGPAVPFHSIPCTSVEGVRVPFPFGEFLLLSLSKDPTCVEQNLTPFNRIPLLLQG